MMINFFFPFIETSALCSNPGGVNSYNRTTVQVLVGVNDESSWLSQTKVDLSSKSISYLDLDCFTNLTNLINLNLYSNQLVCLDSTLFKHLINLQILDISWNQLTSFDPSLFKNLKSLQRLYLSFNKLTTLDPSLFENLKSLSYLYLDNIQLTILNSSLFNGLTNLKYLDLKYNQLTSLESSLFNGLTSLQYLGLNNNKLMSLNSSLFNGLTSLKDLHLSNNQLTSLGRAALRNIGNINIVSIFIDGNPLASLGLNSAYYCDGNILCQCYCSFNFTTSTHVLCSGGFISIKSCLIESDFVQKPRKIYRAFLVIQCGTGTGRFRPAPHRILLAWTGTKRSVSISTL
jgi:hypothetical protein